MSGNSLFDTIRKMVNKPLKDKELTPQEIEARVGQIDNTIENLNDKLLTLRTDAKMQLILYKNPMNSELDKKRIYQQWRMMMYQMKAYNLMLSNLETVKARVDLAHMTVSFGNSMQEASSLVKALSAQSPDLSKVLKDYKRIITSNDLSVNGLEDFDRAIQELEGVSALGDAGEFSRETFEKLANESERKTVEAQSAPKAEDSFDLFLNELTGGGK